MLFSFSPSGTFKDGKTWFLIFVFATFLLDEIQREEMLRRAVPYFSPFDSWRVLSIKYY